MNEAQGFLLAHPLDPHTLEAQILAPLSMKEQSSDPPGGHPSGAVPAHQDRR